MFSRFKNSLSCWPTVMYSVKKSARVKADKPCPLSNAEGPAMKGYKMVIPTVICLFFRQSPFYIIWLIIKIIVDPFNRMLGRWSLADMVKKSKKVVFPFVTNSYTTGSVAFEAWIVWTVTARFYANPCSILRRIVHAMSRDSIPLEATARLGCSIFKLIASNINSVSTNTFAFLSNPIIIVRSKTFHNTKTAKFLARDINKGWHRINLLVKALVREMKRQAKYQCLSFSGMTLSASNSMNFLRDCQ